MGRRRRALALLREAVALLSAPPRSTPRAWTLLPGGMVLEHVESAAWVVVGSFIGVYLGEEEAVEEARVTELLDGSNVRIEWDDGVTQTIKTSSIDHAWFPLRPLAVPISDGELALIRRVLNRPDLPWTDRVHEHAWLRAIGDSMRDLPAQTPGRVREALLLGRATKEPLEEVVRDKCGVCGSKRELKWLVCGLPCGSGCAARVGAINRFVATLREVDDVTAWTEQRDAINEM